MTQPPRQPYAPPHPPGPGQAPPPHRRRRPALIALGAAGALVLVLVAVAVIWRVVSPPSQQRASDYQDLQVAAFNVNATVQGIEDGVNRLIVAEGVVDDKIAAVETRLGQLDVPLAEVTKNRAYASDAQARQRVDALRAALGPYRDGVRGYLGSVRPVQAMKSACAPLGKGFRLSGDVAGWKARSRGCDDAIRTAGSAPAQQTLVKAYRTWLDRLTQAHEATAAYERTRDRAQADRASKLQGEAGSAMSEGLRANATEFARALDANAAAVRGPIGELHRYVTPLAR